MEYTITSGMFNLNLFVISKNSFHSFIHKKFTQKTVYILIIIYFLKQPI
jgi:hypothetical protein